MCGTIGICHYLLDQRAKSSRQCLSYLLCKYMYVHGASITHHRGMRFSHVAMTQDKVLWPSQKVWKYDQHRIHTSDVISFLPWLDCGS